MIGVGYLQADTVTQQHRHIITDINSTGSFVTAGEHGRGQRGHGGTPHNPLHAGISIRRRGADAGQICRTGPIQETQRLRISKRHVLRGQNRSLTENKTGQSHIMQRHLCPHRKLGTGQRDTGTFNDAITHNGRQIRGQRDGGTLQFLCKFNGDRLTGRVCVQERNGCTQRAFPGIIGIGDQNSILLFRDDNAVNHHILSIIAETGHNLLHIIRTPVVTGEINRLAGSNVVQFDGGIAEIVTHDGNIGIQGNCQGADIFTTADSGRTAVNLHGTGGQITIRQQQRTGVLDVGGQGDTIEHNLSPPGNLQSIMGSQRTARHLQLTAAIHINILHIHEVGMGEQ